MCEVKTSKPGISLLFVCIYRSPSSILENNNNLLRLLRRVDQHPAKLKCIVGDFNMPYIDWENGEATDQLGKSLYECSLELFLKQNVTQPTRNKPGQTPSLLDLIFTNDENLVRNVSRVAPLGMLPKIPQRILFAITKATTMNLDVPSPTMTGKYWMICILRTVCLQLKMQ